MGLLRVRELFQFLRLRGQLDGNNPKRWAYGRFRVGPVIPGKLRLPDMVCRRRRVQLRGGTLKTFAFLLIIGAVAGPSAAQSAASKQNKQPFSITITLLSAEVRAGAEVFVRVLLTNTSHSKIGARGIFLAQGLDTSYRYNCRNAAGNSVAKEIEMVGSVHETPALMPGESREQEAPVSRACDLARPGKYTIQVSREIPPELGKGTVKSNRITITVTK